MASFSWRNTWNLSYRIAAWGARATVALRNGFYMSITASPIPWLRSKPRNS